MGLMVLVGLCIAAFARESSSPGSLYVYTRQSLPPIFSSITALALFFAYITTASAVIGGFVAFAYVFLNPLHTRFGLPHIPALVLVSLAAATAGFVAYHDVKVSARLMLYIEGISVTLIESSPPRYSSATASTSTILNSTCSNVPARHWLGVMLAIFSFVGFESATTLGSEARNPLRTFLAPSSNPRCSRASSSSSPATARSSASAARRPPSAIPPTPSAISARQAGIPFLGPVIESASSSVCSPRRWPA